jgi:hypothetical protein
MTVFKTGESGAMLFAADLKTNATIEAEFVGEENRSGKNKTIYPVLKFKGGTGDFLGDFCISGWNILISHEFAAKFTNDSNNWIGKRLKMKSDGVRMVFIV